MKEKLLEMLELQDSVNSLSSHKDWRNGVTPSGKIINWKRCIYMETAEAIDSVTWKHWKNVKWGIDRKNFHVELIDIWHFLMSYLLTKDSLENTLVLVLQNMENNLAEIKLPNELNSENNLILDRILEPYESLMRISLQKSDDFEYRSLLIKQFFICLDSAGISFDDLYKLYIGKNVLNKFRQDHWYKEWTYIKIWNGDEDNVVMQRILSTTTWFSHIYQKLEKEYQNVVV